MLRKCLLYYTFCVVVLIASRFPHIHKHTKKQSTFAAFFLQGDVFLWCSCCVWEIITYIYIQNFFSVFCMARPHIRKKNERRELLKIIPAKRRSSYFRGGFFFLCSFNSAICSLPIYAFNRNYMLCLYQVYRALEQHMCVHTYAKQNCDKWQVLS